MLEEALHEAIGMYLTTESVYVTFSSPDSLAAKIYEHGLSGGRLELELVGV